MKLLLCILTRILLGSLSKEKIGYPESENQYWSRVYPITPAETTKSARYSYLSARLEGVKKQGTFHSRVFDLAVLCRLRI